MKTRLKIKQNRQKVKAMLRRGEVSLRAIGPTFDGEGVRFYRWEAFNSDGKTWDLGSHPFPSQTATDNGA